MMFRKIGRLFYTYYTFWALLLHMLFGLGFLPNTWIVAFFIFVASQVFFWIWPGYFWFGKVNNGTYLKELLTHRFPLIIVPYAISIESVLVLVTTLFIYVSLHGIVNLKRYYVTHIDEIIQEIMK